MLSTRKEAIEKILAKPDAAELASGLNQHAQQADSFISALKSELSAFGDAVMADVDRTNAYHNLWRKGLEMEPTSSAIQLHEHFKKMEEALHKNYTTYTNTAIQLPETLNGLLKKQQSELKRKSN